MSRARRKIFRGVVVSDKMDKTIVVDVESRVLHPLYKKVVTRRKKYYAHDEKNECRKGDIVEIIESRPLSRLKRWRLLRKVGETLTVEKKRKPEEAEGEENDTAGITS